MAEENGEKTEEATQARREEFRNRGQVAHTKELASCLFLAFSFVGLYFFSRYMFQEVYELFSFTMGEDLITMVRKGELSPALKQAGLGLAFMTLPILGAFLVLGLVSSIVQVGFLSVEDALTPKLEKINPLEGLKRMFSLRSLVEGLKSLIKIVLVIYFFYLILKGEFASFPKLIHFSVENILSYMGDMTAKLLASVAAFMLFLSILDYLYQRWDLNQQMMMTKQEVKEEHKSREGDPLIKARVRRMQREIANKRMMQDVPKADVIITNPTHIAVALRYGADVPAPQVIAKGADLVAEKIKELAKSHRIPVIENKPLARTIYKTLKIGQVIPRELYVAVAEVLSYVYKLKKKKVI